jgi:restriction system protein
MRRGRTEDKLFASLFLLPILAVAWLISFVFTSILSSHQRNEIKKRHRSLEIDGVDSLSGEEFEAFLSTLLESRGYTVQLTAKSGDLGVDLVAYYGGNKVAIQAKRWCSNVSRRAVSDAVAGAMHYGCNKCMVITNLYYTDGAKALAKSTDCILIDRDTLADWINELHKTNEPLPAPKR